MPRKPPKKTPRRGKLKPSAKRKPTPRAKKRRRAQPAKRSNTRVTMARPAPRPPSRHGAHPLAARPTRRQGHEGPKAPTATRKRRRFKLRTRALTEDQQRKVDALLVKVYQHAAKELRELERAEAPRLDDARRSANLAAARKQIMATLAAWERRRGDPSPKS